jgi:predicted RNase H-like nuclease
MQYVGVDGCAGGWLTVAYDGRSAWSAELCTSIQHVCGQFCGASLILVDIPIGLPFGRARSCDVLARQLLGQRRSSVFSPPTRRALGQADYAGACRVNQGLTGKKLSKQTWNISKKIAEVDNFLRHHHQDWSKIREAHPELAFWSLAGGNAMIHAKKSLAGQRERLNELKRVDPNVEDAVNFVLSRYLRRAVTVDDVLDAMALAVVASGRIGVLRSLPVIAEYDQEGLPMQIVYAEPK